MEGISNGPLQDLVATAHTRHNVPGVSVATFADGDIHAAAAGIANISTGDTLLPSTIMHIGSITKLFTAALVMRLVQDGLVELERPLCDYLPDVRTSDPDIRERLSLITLLNHSSGIDGSSPPYAADRDDETLAAGVAQIKSLPQLHLPGLEYSYSNAGYVLAGQLVKTLRGRSWYDLVRTSILNPLGLSRAAVSPEEALLERVSVGHIPDSETGMLRRSSRMFLPMSFAPAGATMMTTASELVRFATILASGSSRLGADAPLAPAFCALMRTPTIDNSSRAYTNTGSVGLGWMITREGLLTHAGGGPGISSAVFVAPQGRAIAILTNADYRVGAPLIDEIAQQWLQISFAPPASKRVRRRDTYRPPSLNAYGGHYKNSRHGMTVSVQPETLELKVAADYPLYDGDQCAPTKPLTLHWVADHVFAGGDQDSPLLLEFRAPTVDGRFALLGMNDRLYQRAPSSLDFDHGE